MKKVLFLVLCAITTLMVKGEQFLYWQISQTGAGDAAVEFQGATLFAVVDGETIKVTDTTHVTALDAYTTTTISNPQKQLLAGDLLASTTSFYIELQNYDGGNWTAVGMSEIKTYEDLVTMNAIEGLGSVTHGYGVTPWDPAVNAVPEPSSGLLILVGGALLALRRRKRA